MLLYCKNKNSSLDKPLKTPSKELLILLRLRSKFNKLGKSENVFFSKVDNLLLSRSKISKEFNPENALLSMEFTPTLSKYRRVRKLVRLKEYDGILLILP